MGIALRKTPTLLAVLQLLINANHPLWGLSIIKESGYPSGTVYPLLDRLENAGIVSSQWETDTTRSGARRRLYQLSPEGGAWARELLAVSRARVASVGEIVLA